ncbi:MAG: NosD domain-containing protein [Candidatus Bathyarchaeia archaeon]|jgi:parallel beta-helix repeat protein
MKPSKLVVVMLLAFLFVLVSLPPNVGVNAESRTVVVPDDYGSVQEAIDNAQVGDTVYVKHGVYHENLSVNKTLSLVGENAETTVIDGGGVETAVLIGADGVTVSGFKVINGDSPPPSHYMDFDKPHGIHLLHVSGCIVVDNIVDYTGYGIWLYEAHGNQVTGNNCSYNWDGILFEGSYSNHVSANRFTDNRYGVRFYASTNNTLENNKITDNGDDLLVSVDSFVNNVASSNTVNGKPVCYWVNQVNRTVPSNVATVFLVNCTQIVVENLQIQNNHNAIVLVDTNSCTIKNTQVSGNYFGIRLYNSSNNLITQNNITNNGYSDYYNYYGGLFLDYSSNNTVSKNVFTGNSYGVKLTHSSSNTITENDMQTTLNEAIAIFDGCKHNSITYNNIANNRGGIWFQIPTAENDVYYSNHNRVTNNNIDSNTDWGILLQNVVENVFSENNITNNGKGVRLGAKENSNLFYLNNFINNTVQVEPWGVATWNNTETGNYWNDYTGTDSNGDGIGDTPYIIDENNQDNHPIMEPAIIPEFPTYFILPAVMMAVLVAALLKKRVNQ